ncbi:MAG TPA: EVE domain-containing protein [Xanthobacteraceae bacterium]|nr:EVE domain-containing protein [Xanthobacteraceae bacterium]
MAHWLLKTEPETFSWDDQVKRGAKGEPWSGVRNHQAKLNLMKMKNGERAFFYHSGGTREIVGIVEVIREHYPDPTAKPGEPWVVVDVEAIVPLRKPVRLVDAKAEARLKRMVLVNNTRLSVQPVTDAEWKAICEMGGVKP